MGDAGCHVRARGSIPIELHPIGSKYLFVRLKGSYQRSDKAGVKAHVMVDEKNEITFGYLRTPVESRPEPEIYLKWQPPDCKVLGNLNGVVGRTVVYDDDFQRF